MRKNLFFILIFLASATLVYGKGEMVEIAVEIEEVSEKDYFNLGIKWNEGITLMERGATTGSVANEQAGKIFEKAPLTAGGLPSLFQIGQFNRLTALKADLRALEEEGKANCIARPKLITRESSTAKFLAGGEIPVVATGISGGYIEWKEYGIRLEIKPKLTPAGLIDTFIKTEVSALDWTNAVQNVPAITTRSAETQAAVKSGETILVAGLHQTRKQTTKTGIPLLCKIPYLGALFSHQLITSENLTLMIFVTPRIVKRIK